MILNTWLIKSHWFTYARLLLAAPGVSIHSLSLTFFPFFLLFPHITFSTILPTLELNHCHKWLNWTNNYN